MTEMALEPLDIEATKQRLLGAVNQRPFPRLIRGPLDVDAGTQNPYWDIVRLMPCGPRPWSDPWPIDWFAKELGVGRRELVRTFAWSIPSPADVLWMRDILGGRSVVEIGAGSGYWAWQLRQLDIDVVAVDSGDWIHDWETQWSPVEKGDTSVARSHPARALMLIWPPYDSPMAATALDFYEGDFVIYAGEGESGCTGDDTFHEALERSWEQVSVAPLHPTFDGIHCRLTAYRRAVTA